ncbi:hypothetical protein [Nocardioides sp.]
MTRFPPPVPRRPTPKPYDPARDRAGRVRVSAGDRRRARVGEAAARPR